jgi:predicted nucleotidyltransferase
VSLLRDVVALLEAEGVGHALIGAAARAVHGVSRATADIDLLTLDPRALNRGTWAALEARGVNLLLLKGDPDDPLAGNVRLSLPADRIVDVVVGRHAWQQEIIDAAETVSIGEIALKVARPAGLVLLKLHAGGPKDAWDVRSLLESVEQADAVEDEVERMVPRLPSECRRLWERLREGL